MVLTLPQHMDLRLALHDAVYSDNVRISYMVELLNDLDLFNIEINDIENILVLKVKKTNIKKRFGTSYSHNVFFYNGIIDPIINDIIGRYKEDIVMNLRCKKTFDDVDLDTIDIQHCINISSLYSINVILDNIVNIHL